MASVIELLEFHLTRLRVEIPVESASTPQAAEGSIDIDLGLAESPGKDGLWRVDLCVRMTPPPDKNAPLRPDVDLSISGVFRAPEDMDPAQQNIMVPYNGGLILYGILRGQVAAFSGAFPGGMVALPSLDWQQVVAGIAKRQQEAKKPVRKSERTLAKKDDSPTKPPVAPSPKTSRRRAR